MALWNIDLRLARILGTTAPETSTKMTSHSSAKYCNPEELLGQSSHDPFVTYNCCQNVIQTPTHVLFLNLMITSMAHHAKKKKKKKKKDKKY